MQPKGAKNTVKNKGDTGKVTAVFQNGHKGEHNQKDWQIVEHGRDALYNPNTKRGDKWIGQETFIRQERSAKSFETCPEWPDLGGKNIAVGY